MNFKIKSITPAIQADIIIGGSKSETNRLLILQALFPNLTLANASKSEDSRVLRKALTCTDNVIDIHHAGTAMRFLTAFYAFQKGERVLSGSERMQQRPIKILVEALRELGADIEYLGKEGFPPLKIKGTTPQSNSVHLQASVSSQYISALLLIGHTFPQGLQLHLEGKVLSLPYIKMTLRLLEKLGISSQWDAETIRIMPPKPKKKAHFTIESDWSSASYFYSLAALAETADLNLSTYYKNSLQGDAQVADLYQALGVETIFEANKIHLLKKKDFTLPDCFTANLQHTPDLAQTIACTCSGLGIPFELSGLDNLRIKETDRLKALQNELFKLGVSVEIQGNTLKGTPPKKLHSTAKIHTYEDHRMAMAFAPLALKTPLIIENPSVVGKSFPDFWNKLVACKLQVAPAKGD